MISCAVLVFVCFFKGTLPQKVELSPLLAEVLENGNVSLTCSFETTGSAYGDTTHWERNSVNAGIISKQNGTCNAYGSLQNASLYAWTCPEKGHHSLTLTNVQRDQHAETWTCAVRYIGIGEVKSDLSSVYIKETAVLSPRTADVVENRSVVLTCTLNVLETETILAWYRSDYPGWAYMNLLDNGTCISLGFLTNESRYSISCHGNTSFTLTILKTDETLHDVRWKCRSGFTVISNESIIKVKVPVKTVKITSPDRSIITAKEHEFYSFTCKTSYSRPTPAINWFLLFARNTIEINSTNRDIVTTNEKMFESLTNVLNISPKREENGAELVCKGSNGIGQEISSRKIKMNVIYAPDEGPTINGVANDSVLNIKENDLGNLSCSISWGNPFPHLSWNCSGNTIASTINKQTVRLDLQWTTERRDQDKICVCSSRHIIAGIQIAMVRINVVYSAVIKSFSWIGEESKVYFVVNQTEKVSFICSVEANPASHITIVSPQREQIIMQSNINNVSHTLQNISCENAGEYICTGRNNYTIGEESSSKLILIVRCPPKPSSESTNSETIATPLHVEVILQFTARNYLDIPGKTMLMWFKDNVSLESDNRTFGISSNGLQSNLSIKSITEAEFGKYEMRVSNSLGQYTHVYKVIAKVSVETPVKSHSTSMVGVVAGSVSSCIVIIVAVVISVFFVYRNRLNQKNEQNVRKTKETVFETETPFTYDDLDASKREENTYSQVPAAYEQLDDVNKDENTYMKMNNTNVKRKDFDYINIRV